MLKQLPPSVYVLDDSHGFGSYDLAFQCLGHGYVLSCQDASEEEKKILTTT
jgi:hypothetical protein